MCLEKRNKNDKYTIASKNLYTFKSLNSDLTSPYLGFKYEMNKLYKIRFTRFWGLFGSMVKRGFHSINGSYFVDYYSKFVICKIPKGAKYYIGLDGDVVSSQIMIISEVKPKRLNSNTNVEINDYIKVKYPNNNLINK